ncbi:hypothetical protein CspeluHIS016_0702350 [Cutaneotrichosporon spelunceum]|uniref:Uncharacterized protein n=1 Tax=Cutaneotrichosporon spelunceum TaxID=1672016 RepID=A0AAD3TYH7_9TREE|nr:hypothetical protein CspeluHIS016_0702350 [Cutaneotrichosporon spelunceum]
MALLPALDLPDPPVTLSLLYPSPHTLITYLFRFFILPPSSTQTSSCAFLNSERRTMAPLAQKLGLALLLALSIASLGLSIPMFFTLRLLRTSVANKCTPGGGCSVPAWVRGSPEEGVLVWDSMETARLAEINRHWIPLTYAYITYSALTLIYLAT